MPPAERILVFGDVIDDIVVVPTGPLQSDTDTPSAIRVRPGGSAANTAAWLAAAGAGVAFVGRVGAADVDRHTALLASAGVSARLDADGERPTGTIVVIVEGERRTMLTERGANVALSPAHVDPAGFALVHATGYTLVGHTDAFADLVARAHAAGARVSLNTGSVAAIAEIGVDVFLRATAGVDVIVATAAEAAMLTGRDTPDAAARVLAERHGAVAVTSGRDGAWVAAGTVTRIAPTPARTADPTGAGDAFTAGFLAAIVLGVEPATAGRLGADLAARAVASVGGRPA